MCTLDSGDGVSLEAAGLKGRWEAEILLELHNACFSGSALVPRKRTARGQPRKTAGQSYF